MKLDKRKPSGREKDEQSLELLEKLREQLYFANDPLVRQSAYNLSWLQEDGMEILEEVLFSKARKRIKHAAAYGLRKMRGRMRKPAREILEKGASCSDRHTVEVSQHAIDVLDNKASHFKRFKSKHRNSTRFEIRDISTRKIHHRAHRNRPTHYRNNHNR